MEVAGELARCNKCGFCLTACPTYAVTGEENEAPRGRLELLTLYREKMLGAEEVRPALDDCLLCGSCTAACPQGIRTARLVRHTRAESGGITAALLGAGLSRPGLMKAGGWFARRLGLGTKKPSRPELAAAPDPFRERVAYFSGCSHTYLDPATAAATRTVLAASGVAVTELPPACCGLPLWAAGDPAGAATQARGVLGAFRAAGEPILVADCASCAATLREYPELLPGDPGAVALAAKVRDLASYLAEAPLEFTRVATDSLVVTYHQPCHARESGEGAATRGFLAALPGVEYREAVGHDTCCGGAGLWGVRHPGLSGKILDRKMNAFAATGAGMVVTGCPACRMQLERGVRRTGLKMKVGSVSGLLAGRKLVERT